VGSFAANRKATALIIADGSEIRERLATTLSGLGFGTVSRWSGDTGKSMLCPLSGTRLVLFGPDLGLPKTLEWLDRIESPAIGKTISIVLAPTPFSGDVAAALIKHGAFDVLPPPYAPELLALRINLAMRTPNLEAALREFAGRDSARM
jgi:DNA-binding NtrC family response regulator